MIKRIKVIYRTLQLAWTNENYPHRELQIYFPYVKIKQANGET